MIASLTLFLLWMSERQQAIGVAKWVLPPLMLFLAWMMFSKFKYPSFKGIGWKTKRSLPKFIAILAVIGFTVMNYEWMPFVIFLAYLLYGFFRPFLSRRMQKEIEAEFEDDDDVETESP